MKYAAFFVSYLLGAVPFAFLVVKLKTGKDIREIGSGNVGATNAYRALGIKYALFIFAADFLKGFGPAFFFAALLNIEDPFKIWSLGYGISAVLGHIFPIYLKFKGGKGVSTAAGLFCGLAPIPFLSAFIVWVIILLIWGYVSLASITASIILPMVLGIQYLYFNLFSVKYLLFFSIFSSILIIIMHRNNIRRLKNGNEKRILHKKSD